MMRSLLVLVALVAGLCGCASPSRYDQVKDASRQTQVVLDDQLTQALKSDPAARQARIDRLTSIKYQLSAANVALGAAPHMLKDPAELDTAYTFFEEVYSTLQWNAKLPPSEALRPLPSNPMPGKLNFMPAPAATSPAGTMSTPTIVPTR